MHRRKCVLLGPLQPIEYSWNKEYGDSSWTRVRYNTISCKHDSYEFMMYEYNLRILLRVHAYALFLFACIYDSYRSTMNV